MNRPAEQPTNRRQWLQAAWRYGATGGLGLLTIWLVERERRCPVGDPGGRAMNCRRCDGLARCRLPHAVAERENEVERRR
ncbi:MAG: hypothetical protein HQ581_20815 [Planctomycetes bacterium]|nr:hypothetical protein [Planctomycetota bacterium]